MAMSTTTKQRHKSDSSSQAALKRRIRNFYVFLNQRDFKRCFDMIDPRVREKPASVTLLQYEHSLAEFVAQTGQIKLKSVAVTLHLNEPSKLYEDRDFALGKTTWTDQCGGERSFAERWVREGKTWYTRSTGLVVPASIKEHHDR
jgi:hypothetical protein